MCDKISKTSWPIPIKITEKMYKTIMIDVVEPFFFHIYLLWTKSYTISCMLKKKSKIEFA